MLFTLSQQGPAPAPFNVRSLSKALERGLAKAVLAIRLRSFIVSQRRRLSPKTRQLTHAIAATLKEEDMDMKRHYLAAIPLLSILALGFPSQAETPAQTVIDEMRAINVQRLVLTNQCYECDLVGMDLSGSHLIGADLRGAVLVGANLSWSNLEGADLTRANLEGANLTGAYLTNASLANADLDNVNFSQAILHDVDVAGASMENLNLAGAIVEGTGISIGGDTEPMEEELPILAPNDEELSPPITPWFIPGYPSEEILDVPPQVIPQV